MNCKHYKIRTKKGIKYTYCTLLKKEVNFNCKCSSLEYKQKKMLKKTTYSHSKKEKERFSIIYQDMIKCASCGSKIGHIDKNEVFSGAYRMLSIKYGCVVPFCHDCHEMFHNNRLFNLTYKIKFQKELIKLYGYDWYIETFKINYEAKLEEYLKKQKTP